MAGWVQVQEVLAEAGKLFGCKLSISGFLRVQVGWPKFHGCCFLACLFLCHAC